MTIAPRHHYLLLVTLFLILFSMLCVTVFSLLTAVTMADAFCWIAPAVA